MTREGTKKKYDDAKQRIAEACETQILRLHRGRAYCLFKRFLRFEVSLNLLADNRAGFYYYSKVDVFDKDKAWDVRGPWLQSLIELTPEIKQIYRPPDNQKGAKEEGHIADFYLDNFDWENLNEEDIDRICNLYKRLLAFQGKYHLDNPKKVAEEIQKYNRDNHDEVAEYLVKRRNTANGRAAAEQTADKSNKEGTSDMNKQIQSLLEANFNVILTGTPGTGKTYMAKEVAKEMAEDEWIVEEMTSGKKTGKWKNGRIASVQFHPGYDYSDFVVGMKPVLLSKEGKELEMKNGKYVIEGTDKKVVVDGEAKVSFRWKDGIFKEFADTAREAYDKAEDKENAPKFVFLIDEINRSDLSRVFGELFSLLEEEYRYPNDKGTGITLPNGENFVIPRNLYILGTMNDIDRSVESMDFALRRRFAWFEVKPEDPDSENMDAIIQAKVDDDKISREYAEKLDKAMKALNKLIAPPQKKGEGGDAQKTGDKPKVDLRLGSEYQLGGAIFAKFEKYANRNDPFGELWRNHIENILKEYLRGRSNRGDLLAELEKVYNEKVKVADKSVDSASGGNGAEKPATEGSEPNDKQE